MENSNMNHKELRNMEQLLAMLGDLVQEAMTVPLSGGKCLVERERVLDILEDIRVSLPDELKAASSVLDSRMDILDSAKAEAENIIKSAQNKAMELVDANNITVEANRKAKDILTDANNQAAAVLTDAQNKSREMIGKAEARAADLRKTTGEYLDSTLQKSMEAMSGSLAEMKKIHQQIRAASGKM
ncbi:MAG: hypothetical protein IKL89_00725 [Clostridia bacterium]|nr:hypothetical protein [Clostridia bacterium]